MRLFIEDGILKWKNWPK